MGVIGGAIGYFAFHWLIGQGFYALMLPGAFLGFGCSLPARGRSIVRGVICGLIGLGLGLFAEWKEFPFAVDESFGFMVAHFHEKPPIKLVMLVLGAFLALWIGKDSGPLGRAKSSGAIRPPSETP